MTAPILTFFVAAFYLALGLSAHAQTQVSEQAATPVRAQDPNPSQIIIKAVPSFGTLTGTGDSTPSNEIKSNFGLGFGIAFDASLSDSLSFEFGAEWARRGVAADVNLRQEIMPGTIVSAVGSAKMNLNYLVVPLLLKTKLGSADMTRFHFAAGPYLGIFLSGTQSQTGTVTMDGESRSIDQSQPIEKSDQVGTDFGVRASTGVEIPASSSLAIILGGQYDFGLANIAKDSETKVSTRSLLLNAGLAIRL